jgi:hypothetical protein
LRATLEGIPSNPCSESRHAAARHIDKRQGIF